MKKEKNPDIICLNCKHLDRIRIGGCRAFPGEIPDIILSGQSNHLIPLKGQEGDFVFTPNEEPVRVWRRFERSARKPRTSTKSNRIVELR